MTSLVRVLKSESFEIVIPGLFKHLTNKNGINAFSLVQFDVLCSLITKKLWRCTDILITASKHLHLLLAGEQSNGHFFNSKGRLFHNDEPAPKKLQESKPKNLVLAVTKLPRSADCRCRTLSKLPTLKWSLTQSRYSAAHRCQCDHITPVLREFHWLPVRQRAEFKLALFVYKCLHGLTAPYLIDDCQLVDNSGRRRLRSADVDKRIIPRTNEHPARWQELCRHRSTVLEHCQLNSISRTLKLLHFGSC